MAVYVLRACNKNSVSMNGPSAQCATVQMSSFIQPFKLIDLNKIKRSDRNVKYWFVQTDVFYTAGCPGLPGVLGRVSFQQCIHYTQSILLNVRRCCRYSTNSINCVWELRCHKSLWAVWGRYIRAWSPFSTLRTHVLHAKFLTSLSATKISL